MPKRKGGNHDEALDSCFVSYIINITDGDINIFVINEVKSITARIVNLIRRVDHDWRHIKLYFINNNNKKQSYYINITLERRTRASENAEFERGEL